MISITEENLDKVKAALKDQPRKVNLVLSRSVNRTVTNVKSNISKKVREEYVIKASDIKASLTITKATTARPYATVKSEGKRIDLTKFRLSPSEPRPQNPPKKGYKVQVKKTEGLKIVPRGFLADAKNSVGFFQRVGSGRYPIKRLMGPSIPEMIGKKTIISWVEDQANTMLAQRVEHELQRITEVK